MLRLEGDRDFTPSPEAVWAKLTEASFLVGCVPDLDQVKEAAADRASFSVRPGLAFVRGTLEVEMRLLESSSPSSARWKLDSKGIGSSSTVDATLNFSPREGGTRLHWVAEVTELGGLMKLVPGGLIRGAAQKVINDVLTVVDTKLRREGGS